MVKMPTMKTLNVYSMIQKFYKINDEHNIISETKIQKINRKLINNENKNMVTVNRILT